MKKNLFLLLLVACGLQAWAANHWTGPSEYAYSTSTMLHINLTIEGGSTASVELAAFVGSSCRAVATAANGTTGLYDLRVWGDEADKNKPITVKAFFGKLEYVFATTYTFNGETHMPSLTLNPLMDVSLENPINVTKALPFSDYDLTPHITMIYAGSSTESSIASELTYTWSNMAVGAGFTITNNILSATHEAGTPATLTVTGPNYGSSVAKIQFSASAETEINVVAPTVAVTSVTCSKDASYVFEANIGDNVYAIITPFITVLPDDATNKGLDITAVVDPGVSDPIPGGIATTPGTYDVKVASQSNPEVSCTVKLKIFMPVSFTIPAVLSLSRLNSVEVNFTGLVGDNFDASKVAVSFTNAYTGQPCAVATMADASGMKWNVQGLYSGQYSYAVTYDGVPQLTNLGSIDTSVDIPAEVAFGNGWDWVSLFAITETTSGYDLTNGAGGYQDWLSTDANNRIIEIRSQTDWLYNDFDGIGIFGTITELKPEDGMYKIKSQYASAASRVLNMGPLVTRANGLTLPQVKTGYSWICYPNEFNMDLAALNAIAWPNAQDGDRIIGKSSFAEYQSGTWISTGDFVLEAGKGYMYYTEGAGGYTLLFPGAAPAPAPAPARQTTIAEASTGRSVWRFDASRWADNMTIVATLPNAADYSIGAFVGEECRGIGQAVSDDVVFINVAGVAGEKVHFKLYNKHLETFADLDAALTYASAAGSLKAPIQLGGIISGISSMTRDASLMRKDCYNLNGQRVDSSVKGIIIVDGKKVVKN